MENSVEDKNCNLFRNLRNIRKGKGIPLKVAAYNMGIEPLTLMNYENNKYCNIPTMLLIKLLDYYKVTFEELVNYQEIENKYTVAKYIIHEMFNFFIYALTKNDENINPHDKKMITLYKIKQVLKIFFESTDNINIGFKADVLAYVIGVDRKVVLKLFEGLNYKKRKPWKKPKKTNIRIKNYETEETTEKK